MSSHVLLKTIALGVLTSIVSARNVAVRWSPARETGLPARGEGGGGVDYGVSPVPTQIPGARPELGGMELFKRYQIGSDTCGFAAGFKVSEVAMMHGASVRLITSSHTRAQWSGNK